MAYMETPENPILNSFVPLRTPQADQTNTLKNKKLSTAKAISVNICTSVEEIL